MSQMRRPTEASTKTVSVISILRRTPALKSYLTQSIALSFLVQVQVAVFPLFAGIIIDDVIPVGDVNLLYLATFGFCALLLVSGFSGLVRSFAVSRVSSTIWWCLSKDVFASTIHLPLRWFHSKPQADVLQVFSAVDQTRLLMTSLITAVVVDGLLVIVSLAMLLFVSPVLAAISFLLLATYVGIRLVGIPIIRRRQTAAIEASVKESAHRMEAVRAIQTIRALGGERAKEAAWTSALSDSIRAAALVSDTTSVFSSLQSTAMQVIGLVTYFAAATLVLGGDLSVGAMIAAIAYQAQFTQRASFLFEQYASWKNIDAHVSRIEEVFRTTPEAYGSHTAAHVRGDLDVIGLGFRYGGEDPAILKDVNFAARSGEIVAIVGASGAGKTTLSKIIGGLYEPSEGCVLLDGVPLKDWDRTTLRAAVGIVLQDDEIFAGTIQQNVSFFAQAPSTSEVWTALELAGLAEEIRRLPLREDAQVGDMGNALSGGQRQRLQLARLFYRKPRVMILDEATAHLDIDNETGILQSIRKSGALVFLIAHRPETIRSADRVLRVDGSGQVVEVQHADAVCQLHGA